MKNIALGRGLFALTCGWLWVLACGARSGVPAGQVAAAGAENGGAANAEPECLTAEQCPQPPPGQCGSASCTDGVCQLDVGMKCDDGDPCTVDSCAPSGCVFTDGRVDADGDGVFASGTSLDPKAALGCGKDCDDGSSVVHPGASELCDGRDNDCNGVVDEGAVLLASPKAPTVVSPPDAEHAVAAGLGFDGEAFGASITSWIGRSQGQFQRLSAQGQLLGGPQRIARVNAESYGGGLVWTGERYLTAYQDARQAQNYEIYFDLLNRKGERLISDLRITSAPDYSLRPSVVWTGAEGLVVWDDRRLEASGGTSAIFGQRVSIEGKLLGANVQLSPNGVEAEGASIALSEKALGIAFASLDPSGNSNVRFMTVSRTLEAPTKPFAIEFENADGPVVTALNDRFVITFHQFDSISYGPAIFAVTVDANGVLRGPLSITVGAAHAQGNTTFSYGDRFVMVWADDQAGPYQLFAQTFDKNLAPLTPRVRVATSMTDNLGAALAQAADGGLGVLYTDWNNGTPRALFTRLDCAAGGPR